MLSVESAVPAFIPRLPHCKFRQRKRHTAKSDSDSRSLRISGRIFALPARQSVRIPTGNRAIRSPGIGFRLSPDRWPDARFRAHPSIRISRTTAYPAPPFDRFRAPKAQRHRKNARQPSFPLRPEKRRSREPSRARMEPHSSKRPAKQPTETDRDDRTPVSSNGFSLRRSSLSERPVLGPSESPNDKTLPCATYADRRAGPKPNPAGHRPRSTHAPRESARAADHEQAGDERMAQPPGSDFRSTVPGPFPRHRALPVTGTRSSQKRIRAIPQFSPPETTDELRRSTRHRNDRPTAKKHAARQRAVAAAVPSLSGERHGRAAKNRLPRTRKRASGNSGRPFVSAGSAP